MAEKDTPDEAAKAANRVGSPVVGAASPTGRSVAGASAVGGPVTVQQFLPELRIPEGLTLEALVDASLLVRRWENDPDGDPSAVSLVAEVYRLLRLAEKS